MREPADRNWPEHEVKRFLDQLAAGGHDFQRLVERLPVIVYTAELGERGPLALRQPPGRGDPRLPAGGLRQRSRALGQPPASGGPPSRRSTQETEITSATAIPRRSNIGCTPARARWSGSTTRRFWKPTRTGSRSGTGCSTTSAPARMTENELQRALSQQAVVARLGERAMQNSDPQEMMEAATELIGKVDGVHSACIWELGRDGRRLNLRAGLEGVGGRSRPPGLGLPRLPRRRRARLRHPRDRLRLGRRRRGTRCRRCCGSSAPPAASRW